jgi:hypothetical protein
LQANRSESKESDYTSLNDTNETGKTEYCSNEEWILKRRKLRQDLENMDLTVAYLKRKKNRTEIEERLLKRMMFINKDIQTDLEV